MIPISRKSAQWRYFIKVSRLTSCDSLDSQFFMIKEYLVKFVSIFYLILFEDRTLPFRNEVYQIINFANVDKLLDVVANKHNLDLCQVFTKYHLS